MDNSYPKNPTSIGEHIRKKRMELKLFQKDLAVLFGVSEDCITYWENNRSTPQITYYPALIRFLGYYPFELDLTTFEGRIKAYRYLNGLSRKHFAKLMVVDPQTVIGWENGRGKRPKREKMERFLSKYDFNAD
ncbi:helix-turn-helix transcriptional regulator [Sphingobacterium sp. UBA7038]|uniref:helix-turn-helix transcriptional regulator n=1 Tax=Sphingobacterium sp. UBA7038 TaxID=1947515 RepID=UPI00257EE5D3|nr:helix-turn-helix transcriptional regulator [Sphingobacterium sp. UBA7038]